MLVANLSSKSQQPRLANSDPFERDRPDIHRHKHIHRSPREPSGHAVVQRERHRRVDVEDMRRRDPQRASGQHNGSRGRDLPDHVIAMRRRPPAGLRGQVPAEPRLLRHAAVDAVELRGRH